MHKIYLPFGCGDFTPDEMAAFCESYGCKSKYQRAKAQYEVTTDNPVNFFWLGANMVNGYINALNKNIENLKKQLRHQ